MKHDLKPVTLDLNIEILDRRVELLVAAGACCTTCCSTTCCSTTCCTCVVVNQTE
jgi:hypothetical protein